MLEDCYLCECNITFAQKLKNQVWRTIYVSLENGSRVFLEQLKIAHYNDVIDYNSIMMFTHGDFNYVEV